MNVTLEFALPENRQELELCLAADDLAIALHEVRQHLRSQLKHAELTEETRAALECVRDLLPLELMERL